MSEFQYYEFGAIDRPLTAAQRELVSQYSRRAQVNAHRAVFSYSYSDFPADELDILKNYFDILLYVANWGSLRFAFRMPNSPALLKAWQAFVIDDMIQVKVYSDCVLIDLNFSEQESSDDDQAYETTERFDELLEIRALLLAGDLRPLYLAWLRAVHLASDWMDTEGLPVPFSCGELASLRDWAELLRLDSDVYAAACQLQAPQIKSIAPLEMIQALSAEQKNDYLLRLYHNEAQLSSKLRGALNSPKHREQKPKNALSVTDIWSAASAASEQQQQALQDMQQALHTKRMRQLKADSKQLWQEAKDLINARQTKAYDQSVVILKDLRELALNQGTMSDFQRRVNTLADAYKNRPALQSRFQQAKLI